MAEIRGVHLGNTDYDLAAKYILSNDSTPVLKTWQDILDLVSVGFEIVVLQSLPTPSAAVYEQYKNCIVLVSDGTTTGNHDEYVITISGDPDLYRWEKVGTTTADLADYVKKGTYTTGSPSNDSTGTVTVKYGQYDDSALTEGANFNSATYDVTRASTYLPIKTDGAGSHTHSVTLPLISSNISFVGTVNFGNISKDTDSNGSHSHTLSTSTVSFVSTTPSWTASVDSSGVLSFSFSSGSTSMLTYVGAQNTGSAGSHHHTLQYYDGEGDIPYTSRIAIVNSVNKSATTLYYVGSSSSAASISASVSTNGTHSHTMDPTNNYSSTEYYTYINLPFGLASHNHNFQHVHSLSGHTHSVSLN